MTAHHRKVIEINTLAILENKYLSTMSGVTRMKKGYNWTDEIKFLNLILILKFEAISVPRVYPFWRTQILKK